MRKKIALVLVILMVSVATTVFFAACKPDPVDPINPSVEIKREDCDLVFGTDGIQYKGILAPIDSDPTIGGAVIATVALTAKGANFNVSANIIKLNITLRNGETIVIDSADAISEVLVLDFATGFYTDNGKYLTEDVPTDSTFKFTMPATDDMTYVGATFAITVRVTVTHANGTDVNSL